MKTNLFQGKKYYFPSGIAGLAMALAFFAPTINHSAYSQDTRFSQSYAVPLRLNPATMGANPEMKAILNYRTQWANIADGFNTYHFTFLFPLLIEEQGKLDIGLSAFNDQFGAFNNNDILIALSYSLRISGAGHYLTGALSGGVVQKTLDNSGFTYDDQYVLGAYSANNATGDNISGEKVMNPDFGGGVMWHFTPKEGKVHGFGGVGVFHHNRANQSFTGGESGLSLRSVFHGGLKISAGEKFEFTPNLILTRQGGAEETATGVYTGYNFNEQMKLILGVWYRYRYKDVIAATLGFEHKMFTIGYSFDMASFDMSKAVAGSLTHEITAAFKLNRAEKKKVEWGNAPFGTF